MKCEKCGNELIGGTIICRACHHNNALRGVSQWRARKTGDLNPAPARHPEASAPPAMAAPKHPFTTPPRIVPRKDAPSAYANAAEAKSPEPNVLHFPATTPGAPAATSFTTAPETKPATNIAPSGALPNAPAAKPPATSTSNGSPQWREQLRERVREVREKRSGALTDPNKPAQAVAGHTTASDENPIVQSALNRIRRANYPQPATVAVRTARQAAQTAAFQRRDARMTEAAPQSSALHSAATPQAAARSAFASNAEARTIGPRNAQAFAPRPTDAATRRIAPRTAAPEPTIAARPDQNGAVLPPIPVAEAAAAPRLPRLGDSRTLTPRNSALDGAASAAQTTSALAGVQKVSDSGRLPSADSFLVPVTVRRTTGSLRNSGALQTGAVNTTEIIEIPQTPAEAPARSASATRPATLTATGEEATPASLWMRTIAGTCDLEAVAVAYLPLFYLYARLKTSLGNTSFSIMVSLLIVISFVYQMVMLLYADRTFGMAMFKLRLVDARDEERAVTFGQRVLRAAAATVAFLLPPINLIVARLSPAHRSLPDLLSGTTVTPAAVAQRDQR